MMASNLVINTYSLFLLANACQKIFIPIFTVRVMINLHREVSLSGGFIVQLPKLVTVQQDFMG